MSEDDASLGMPGGWMQVGEIGVDAGLCWLGDPCYFVPRRTGENFPTEPNSFEQEGLTDWSAFLKKLREIEREDCAQFNYAAGHKGLGVTVSTGYGDGVYPVLVRYVPDGIHKRVGEVRVVFISKEEEKEELARLERLRKEGLIEEQQLGRAPSRMAMVELRGELQWAKAKALMARVKELAAMNILDDLWDDSPCDLDREGSCQEHGWFGSGECPHARAVSLFDMERKYTQEGEEDAGDS